MEDNKEGAGVHGNRKVLPYDDQGFGLAGFPAGYRFMPTDEELIGYLATKLWGQPSHYTFKEIDLYSYTPQDLEVQYGARREKEMYFFTKATLKFSTGERRSRVARGGLWKGSTKKTPITDRYGYVIGHKASLKYQENTNTKKKLNTKWIMYEYVIPSNSGKVNEYVLCKVYKIDKEQELQVKAPQENPNHINNVDDQQNLEHQIPQTNLDHLRLQQQDLAHKNQNLQPQDSQDMVIEDQGNMSQQIQHNYPNRLQQQDLAYDYQDYQPRLPYQNMEITDHGNMSRQIPQTFPIHLQVQQQVPAYDSQIMQISNDFIFTEEELIGNRNGDLMAEYVVLQAESTDQEANI